MGASNTLEAVLGTVSSYRWVDDRARFWRESRMVQPPRADRSVGVMAVGEQAVWAPPRSPSFSSLAFNFHFVAVSSFFTLLFLLPPRGPFCLLYFFSTQLSFTTHPNNRHDRIDVQAGLARSHLRFSVRLCPEQHRGQYSGMRFHLHHERGYGRRM